MVFSSVPLYLDPPNWQQLPNQQQQLLQAQNENNINHHEQNQDHLISQQQQAQQLGIGGGITGLTAQQNRANSMSERARLAKIPPPDIPQKCPRCDSTNTKFCYYNNYSLTQPRHFCKTCRRYWTRGGALRNVPVGGGCRRNKRMSSKSSSGGRTVTSIKSSSVLSSVSSPSTLVNGERLHHSSNILEELGNNPRGINVNSMLGVGNNSSMSFMASLQNMAQLGGMSSNMGLFPFSSGSIHTNNSQNTPPGLGPGNGGNNGSYNQQQNIEYPQQQIQFPNFLAGFEIPSPFQNIRLNNNNNNNNQNQQQQQQQQQGEEMKTNNNNNMSKISGLSMTSAVKMEGNGHQGLNLPKQLMMGISNSTANDNQFWCDSNITNNNNNNTVGVTTMWTDLSGLNSSSTSHPL